MMANVRIPPAHQPAPSRRRRNKRLNLERLEPRLLLAADTSASAGILTHGGICSCPICSGVGLEQFQPEPAQVVSGGGTTSAASIAGLPQLSSRPGAAATIFLDFDGNTEALWGSYTNVVTRVFDRDGDETSFSASEISAIQEIWARVAEDFAPFNINVTTVEPPSFANKVAIRVAIGGNYSDWFGPAAGGVAYVGAFYNSSSNVAYVFEDALGNGNPKYVAEAASHEAGHTFGLYHQAVWNGNQLVEEYNSGDSNWAPIMGVGYYSTRTTWNSGPTSNSPSQIQDDLAVLANSSNGFGYVADDYGGTTATATDLVTSGGNVNTTGLIGNNSDWDLFKFTTDGGALNLSLNVAQFGANLDSALDLLNAAGQTILSSSPSASLGSSLATTLAAGTYYVAVHSSGGYGNLGTYTLSGSVPGGGGGSQTQNPEIEVTVGSVSIADGATVNYGTRTVGTAITRMFVVRNAGTGTLNLTPLNANSIPAGFTLVANLGATSLAPGESTSFKIQMTSTAAGTYSGVISLGNNDSDESPFEITIRGVVEAPEPQAVVRYIDNGASGFSTSGTWYRVTGTGRESDIHRALPGSGTTVATWTFSGLDAGQYRVSATWPGASYYASNAPFSIYNGSQALKTVSINQKAASSGFSDAGSQWADLGTVTITGNTLVVRLTNAANNWVVADAIRIESVGSSGTTGGGGGQVEPAPEIDVKRGNAEVADGGTVDFGTTTVGTPRGRVITITNTGTGTLSLTPINANSLPAGFLLVSNIGSTSLAPGQSTSFTVRMTASAAGTFSGSISIGNNDSDESPYDLVLTGVVSGSQPQSQSEVRYIDNGSSGYSTAGTWYSSSSGRDGDANWTVNGSGSNVATWTFTGLAAGQYRVSATWPSASHYASDAPYSVYNGSQFLGTSRVSQKAAPSGLSDAGSQWKDLGNFTITGNTLVVKLSNDANGWVAADAIRIELIAAGSKYGHGALPGASPAQQLLASAALAEGQSTGLLQQATDAVFSTDPEDAWLSVQETALSRIGAQLASQLSSEQPELEILHQTEELLDELAASLSQSREDSLGGLGARLAAILDQDA